MACKNFAKKAEKFAMVDLSADLSSEEPDAMVSVKSKPVTIRLATSADVALLPAIESAAAKRFQDYLDILEILPDKLENVVPISFLLRSQVANRLWVAKIDKDPVGFLVARPLQESFFIVELDVLPEFSRQGIGSALMQAAMEASLKQGFDTISLTTFRHTPWTIPFYQKLGFSVVTYEALPFELQEIVDFEETYGFPKKSRVTMQYRLQSNPLPPEPGSPQPCP
jgi:GNAT superfamily N-acetyltransferase